jgi:hypothetical protein
MTDIKRLKYTDGQLLNESDFRDEQDYHRDMRKRHNRSAHSWGIVEGFEVKTDEMKTKVIISPGTAFDKDGQELILLQGETPTPPGDLQNASCYVTAKFAEIDDPTMIQKDTAGGGDYSRRTIERPAIEITDNEPPKDGSVIVLAKLTADAEGKITLDSSARSRSVSSRIDPESELIVGRFGVGTTDPVSKLTINPKITHDGGFSTFGDAQLTIFDPNDNGGDVPNGMRDILHLVREGISGKAYGNKVSLALGRYEHAKDASSRTQLDIKLTDDSFNSHNAVMTLRSNGNVGIGTTGPMSTLSVKGGLSVGTSYAEQKAAPNNGLTVEGKVGIGKTDPEAELDIEGNTYIRGVLHVGKHDKSESSIQFRRDTIAHGIIKWGFDEQNHPQFKFIEFRNTKTQPAANITAQNGIFNGNVGIGATGPEAKLDVNGDVIVSGVIQGRYTEKRDLNSIDKLKEAPYRKGFFNSIAKQQPAIIQGVGWGNTANLDGNTADPQLFAIGYSREGKVDQTTTIFNITTGTIKTFIIDHPLHQDKYLMHATLEGPEGAVYYRGTAQLKSGKMQIQLPRYFEGLTRTEDRTILLTNIDGFDPLTVLTQDGAQIKDGRFIVASSNEESTQAFHWEVKAIRKDVQALEVEPLKSAIKVERFGPYTYAVPVDEHGMAAPPRTAYPNTTEPQTHAGDISGACGPRGKIASIR